MNAPGAIAIFVKTPGVSPIKTRLSLGLGERLAMDFYLRSIKATEAVVSQACKRVPELTPYWAVAEREGANASYWKTFPTLWQGEGGLGERLSNVYRDLIGRYSYVAFIGADSPQISANLLADACQNLAKSESSSNKFVLGRARDGGFYFFGSADPAVTALWPKISYSQPDTSAQLIAALAPFGSPHELPLLTDVDSLEDLDRIIQELESLPALRSEQQGLLAWLRATREK